MTEEELNEKWNMHDVVQKAIESAHVNPSPQTIKMIDNLNKKIDETAKISADFHNIVIEKLARIETSTLGVEEHLKQLNSKVATNVLRIADQDVKTAVLSNEFLRVLEKLNDSKAEIKEEGKKHTEIGKELELLRNLNTLITKHDAELFGEDGLVKWKDRAWGIFKVVSIIWVVTTFIIGLKLFN